MRRANPVYARRALNLEALIDRWLMTGVVGEPGVSHPAKQSRDRGFVLAGVLGASACRPQVDQAER